jgi:Fe-S-cluster containining protein
MSSKIRFVPTTIQGVNGLDLQVMDPAATVQDYLDAVNRAIEEALLYRGRADREHCLGCDLCCQERIPLTWIDVLRLREHIASGEKLTAFIRRYAHVHAEGSALDITLRLNPQGRCLLLNTGRKACLHYGRRPLVCQTFICCPQTRRARKLREQIVNLGEDELVRQWLLENRRLNSAPHIDSASGTVRVRLEDWVPTPFNGKTAFDQVPLRELCPPALWREMTATGK